MTLRSCNAWRTMCFVSVFLFICEFLILSDFRSFCLSCSSSAIVVPLVSLRPSDGVNGKAVKKDTWVRVTVALVLLGIVLGCMLLERHGWWSDPEGLQSDLSKDAKTLEEDHHHHAGEEDDDHKDGDDHHDSDGHSHGHTSLYHHGVVLTSSGLNVSIINSS